jgi:hypothetical protein
VALTWPLLLHPASLVPSDLGDPLLNTWIMSWNARMLPLTAAWWNAPQFVPITGALGFSEHLLGLAPITTPVILVTGDALLAYNIAFLLAFPLSALSAHYLAYTITRRHDVSFVAGIAFAFAPYRMPQVAHVQVVSAYWMPLALAGLHKFFDDPQRRLRWLALFAGGWLFQALTCGYYLFYLSVLVVLWLAWFALSSWRDLLKVIAAWGVAVAALSPILYGYWTITRAYNLKRGGEEIRTFSADILSVLKASYMSRAWHWLQVVTRPESDLFPGLTVVIVVVIAASLAWRAAAREPTGHVRGARILIGLGTIGLVIGMSRLFFGPFKLAIGGLRLLSVTAPEKPISVAAVCFVAAGLAHPAVRTAWRRRSPLGFYILGAIAMWLMSLGPAPTFMNRQALYKAPYAWLLMLPGVDGVRVPARFWTLAILCLAMAAALGVRYMMRRWPRAAGALPAVVIAGLLIDGWPYRLPMEPRPAERPNHSDAALRLDLPLGPTVDTLALYRAVSHKRPIFNGYSGYFAPHYSALDRLLADQDPGIISRLSELGSIEVMVEHELDPGGTWRAFMDHDPRARRIQSTEAYTSYFVPEQTEKTSVASGRSVPIVSATASVNQHLWPTVTDGNLYTRWHAGREQRRGDWFSVDLGEQRNISGVEMLIGGYTADFPRELLVETSADGATWTPAWSGRTTLVAFSGALRDPRNVPLSLPITPRPARYVRFIQTGPEMVHYWSIAELRILNP